MSRYESEQERLEAAAERRNRRLAQQHPLFAAMGALDEVARTVTADDIRRHSERYATKLCEDDERISETARRLRARYAQAVSPEQWAEADARWRAGSCPKRPWYEADYWRERLLEAGISTAPVRLEDRIIERILSGQVTQFADIITPPISETARLTGAQDIAPRWAAGSVHEVIRGSETVACIRIVSIRRAAMGAITDDDAKQQGYRDLDALKTAEVFRRGEWRPDTEMWLVTCELIAAGSSTDRGGGGSDR